MNWLYYLLEANLYLTIFYVGYLLLFRNLTFYSVNRWYLLISCIMAFVIPFLQIGYLKPAEIINQVSFIRQTATVTGNALPVGNKGIFNFTWQNVLLAVYIAGATLSLVLFVVKITKLYLLIKRGKATALPNYRLVKVEGSNTAFSFFGYLFITENVNENDLMTRHELVHIRQKHSADVVFLEIVKALNWFNPVVYLLQKSLKNVHEYIADKHSATDKLAYSSFLLNNAYGIAGPDVAHSFFNNNLLKQRIIMLNKPNSGKTARLKYLAILPLTGGMLCLSTLTFSKNYSTLDLSPRHVKAGDAHRLQAVEIATKNERANVGATNSSDTGKKAQVVRFPAPKAQTKQPPAPDVKMVKFPEPKSKSRKIPVPNVKLVKFPAPKVETKQVISGQANVSTTVDDFTPLYKYIQNNVRYPAADRKNKATGRVIAQLVTDKNGVITDVKILRAPSETLAAEVGRTLKSYTQALTVKPGATYTVPVAFHLIDKNDKDVFNETANTDNKQSSTTSKANNSETTNYSLNEVVIVAYAPAD